MLLSKGRGLGRSLSYVGRSRFSLFMMLHGSVVHKLPFAAASEAFAWNRREKVALQSYLAAFAWNRRAKVASRAFACNCCAKAALQNYVLSFCVELSCRRCVAKLFPNLVHGAVLQNLPFKTIAQAFEWHHRARAVFRSYFLSFFMELSCERYLAKLFLKILYGTVAQKNCQAEVLGAVWAMLGAVKSVCP